ncbi:MAG TPA: DinB family protein [Thermoanaerobaculia bacterium]|nr:DinB family protein [Thermoanaerobaculia bacterium]
MSIESPQTREQLIAAFEQQERESVAYWSAFDTDAFFRRIGESWSPAETVRHLSKSTRPVVKALATFKIVLRFMFGKPGRVPMTYDGLVARYRQGLAEGGQAGRFAPSPREESDREAWRRTIMNEAARVNGELRTAIARWPESKLDRFQLPHPLLGKLTVREMLFFTLYHQRHHIAVVERHLKESGGG